MNASMFSSASSRSRLNFKCGFFERSIQVRRFGAPNDDPGTRQASQRERIQCQHPLGLPCPRDGSKLPG